MPKQKRNPRIIVAFEREQYDLLKRVAELQDTSMAKVVKSFFELAEPMLRDVCVALEAAKEAKGRPAAQVIAAMSRLQASVEEATQQAVDQADMFSGALSRTTKKLKKQAARATEKGSGKRQRAKR